MNRVEDYNHHRNEDISEILTIIDREYEKEYEKMSSEIPFLDDPLSRLVITFELKNKESELKMERIDHLIAELQQMKLQRRQQHHQILEKGTAKYYDEAIQNYIKLKNDKTLELMHLTKKYNEVLRRNKELQKQLEEMNKLKDQVKEQEETIKNLLTQLDETNKIKIDLEKKCCDQVDEIQSVKKQNQELNQQINQMANQMERDQDQLKETFQKEILFLQNQMRNQREKFDEFLNQEKLIAAKKLKEKDYLISLMVRVFSERTNFAKKQSETDEEWFNWYMKVEKDYNPKQKQYQDLKNYKKINKEQREFLDQFKY